MKSSAALLRLMLLAELGFYLLLGGLLHHYAQWRAGPLLLLILLLAFAGRALTIKFTYFYSVLYRSPVPPQLEVSYLRWVI